MQNHRTFARFRWIFIVSLFYLGRAAGQSATTSAPAVAGTNGCRIIGTDTVIAGSIASFTLSSCTSAQWTTSCDSIVAQTPTSVTVSFKPAGCGTVVLSATSGGAAISKAITVLTAPSFSTGAIAGSSQVIAYNGVPAALQIGPAAGGLCGGAITYQWSASTDSIHFSIVSGANAQNYQPGALTTTTWFRRQAGCSASGVVTGSAIKVTVNPPLNMVSINPTTQSINYDQSAAMLSITAPGVGTNIRYQWQSATDPAFATAAIIPGATSGSYSPDSLSATTYYRMLMVTGGDTVCSSPAVVTVLPPLTGGTLLPASQTITTDSLPGLLTCTGFSGGNGLYAFQWYSSPDGTNWSLIPGVQSAGYDPGVLTTTTYYLLQVISNGVPAASTKAVIYVNP